MTVHAPLPQASAAAEPPRPGDRPAARAGGRLAVGLATAGRRDMLSDTVRELARQSRPPDELVICPASAGDVDEAEIRRAIDCPIRIVPGPRGLTCQRNSILAAVEADFLVFFDDDFFPAPDYLAAAERLFASRPDALMITGKVIADGAPRQGYSPDEARALLRDDQAPAASSLTPVYNGYGCNMAIRMANVRALGVSFDPALPLYGWLEDVDFSRALVARGGAILKSAACRGVHLGTKGGRTSGLRYGYSQIANPLYLAAKGTMTPWRAAWQMAQNLGANFSKAFNPEPWVDRRGRIKGNLIGFGDLVRGRLRPEKILDLG
jgi:GT2 family glycosyltransferase